MSCIEKKIIQDCIYKVVVNERVQGTKKPVQILSWPRQAKKLALDVPTAHKKVMSKLIMMRTQVMPTTCYTTRCNTYNDIIKCCSAIVYMVHMMMELKIPQIP